MKLSITILSVLLLSLSSNARDSTLNLNLLHTFKGGIRDFTSDNLGNVYLLYGQNQIKKFNAKGDSVGVYNDVRRYGNIYSIDATNPLKVLIYYKDFSTLIVLDRLLNVKNTIDLRQLNILQARAITSSYDNNYWVYDELENKIKRVDDNSRVIMESSDLRQALEQAPAPVNMFDRDGQLYLYDPRQGLYIFDYYGANRSLLQLLQYNDLQVLDKNTITARDSMSVTVYNPATFQSSSYKIFDQQNQYSKINFNVNRVYALTKAGDLEVYEVVK